MKVVKYFVNSLDSAPGVIHMDYLTFIMRRVNEGRIKGHPVMFLSIQSKSRETL